MRDADFCRRNARTDLGQTDRPAARVIKKETQEKIDALGPEHRTVHLRSMTLEHAYTSIASSEQ